MKKKKQDLMGLDINDAIKVRISAEILDGIKQCVSDATDAHMPPHVVALGAICFYILQFGKMNAVSLVDEDGDIIMHMTERSGVSNLKKAGQRLQ